MSVALIPCQDSFAHVHRIKENFIQLVDCGVVVCGAFVIVDVVSFSGSGDVATLQHSALHFSL